MQLLVSAKVLAATNLHPEDEPEYSEDVAFRPGYAVETNARNIDLSRFTCSDIKDNMIISISDYSVIDQNGYVVVFSSFAEMDLSSPHDDHSECKSVAFNYYQPGREPKKRYKATVLTPDIISDAIKILTKSDDFDSSGKDIETLLAEFFKLLEIAFPKSSKPSENLKFIKDYMKPLIYNKSFPCWERESMKGVLALYEKDLESSDGEKGFDDFICQCEKGEEGVDDRIFSRAFLLRWVNSNFPFLSKIISHKTDGAHRDFAYDALFTGTFGSFEGDVKTRLIERFSEDPHPINTKINVDYTIPKEFNADFVQTQKKYSVEKQKIDGKDKKLDLLDVVSPVKDGLDGIDPEDLFLNETFMRLNMQPLLDPDNVVGYMGRMNMLDEDGNIERGVRAVDSTKLVKDFSRLSEHCFIVRKARQILEFLRGGDKNIADYVLLELKKWGIDLNDIFQKNDIDDLLHFLLLPKCQRGVLEPYGITSFCGWNAHSSKSDCQNFIHLMLNNKKLFTSDQKNATMKAFFNNPSNKTEYHHFETGEKKLSDHLPAPFVCIFWLLLFSFLSKEVSDEVRNILRKVTPYNSPEFSKQNTSGDGEKALNYVILLVVSIHENFCQLESYFDKALKAAKIDARSKEFGGKPKPMLHRFLPLLMSQACVRALHASSLHGVDPVITDWDRKWLGIICHSFCNTKCCDKFNECDCPSSVLGPSCLNLRAAAESFICTIGEDRRDESGKTKLLQSLTAVTTSAGISISLPDLLATVINVKDLGGRVEFSNALSGNNIPSSSPLVGNNNGEILGKQLTKISKKSSNAMLFEPEKYQKLKDLFQNRINTAAGLGNVRRVGAAGGGNARRGASGGDNVGAESRGGNVEAAAGVGDPVNASGGIPVAPDGEGLAESGPAGVSVDHQGRAKESVPVEDVGPAVDPGSQHADVNAGSASGMIDGNKPKKRSRSEHKDTTSSGRNKRGSKKGAQVPESITSSKEAKRKARKFDATVETLTHIMQTIHNFCIVMPYMKEDDQEVVFWNKYILPFLESDTCVFSGCNESVDVEYDAEDLLVTRGIKEDELWVSKVPTCKRHRHLIVDSGNGFRQYDNENSLTLLQEAKQERFTFVYAHTGEHLQFSLDNDEMDEDDDHEYPKQPSQGGNTLGGNTLGGRPLGGKMLLAQRNNDDDEEMFDSSDQNLSHDEQAGNGGSQSHFMALGPGKTLLHGQTLRSGQRPLGGKTAQGSNDDDEEIMFEPSDQNLSHDEQAGKCGSRSHFMTLGPGKTLLHGQTFTENSSSSDDELVANLKGGKSPGGGDTFKESSDDDDDDDEHSSKRSISTFSINHDEFLQNFEFDEGLGTQDTQGGQTSIENVKYLTHYRMRHNQVAPNDERMGNVCSICNEVVMEKHLFIDPQQAKTYGLSDVGNGLCIKCFPEI